MLLMGHMVVGAFQWLGGCLAILWHGGVLHELGLQCSVLAEQCHKWVFQWGVLPVLVAIQWQCIAFQGQWGDAFQWHGGHKVVVACPDAIQWLCDDWVVVFHEMLFAIQWHGEAFQWQ